MSAQQTAQAIAILRLPEVLKRVGGVNASTLWRWERQNKFPRRIQIGPNSVGWRSDDIDAFVASRPVVGGER